MSYSDVPMYFAYHRTSVNNEHRETFHSHLGVEILLIHEGKGTMIVNNNRYEIKPGMLCIFQPLQLHHLTLDYAGGQSFERSMAIFEPTMFADYFDKWPALHDFYAFICSGQLPYPCLYELQDLTLLDHLFRNMNERMPTLPEADKQEEISLFLVNLYRLLKQEWERRNQHAAVYQTRRKTHQVENILSWIEANYAVPYRLNEMSQSLHISPFHLSHLFKEATGITITEYIATRRIHQSVRLLTTTNKPVSQIAEEIGFVNSSYFCKLFKSQLGVTPHQYRKKWTPH